MHCIQYLQNSLAHTTEVLKGRYTIQLINTHAHAHMYWTSRQKKAFKFDDDNDDDGGDDDDDDDDDDVDDGNDADDNED